jgi:CRP/FNR family transcriptional regulator
VQRPASQLAQAQLIANPQAPSAVTKSPWPAAVDMKLEKIILTRQDMASFAGTTYETVFRTINDLEAEKLIKSEGKKIGILKEEGLVALTEK